MTYFLTGNPQYHRRGVVSRSCSGWERVGPTRYGRQEFWNRLQPHDVTSRHAMLSEEILLEVAIEAMRDWLQDQSR